VWAASCDHALRIYRYIAVTAAYWRSADRRGPCGMLVACCTIFTRSGSLPVQLAYLFVLYESQTCS